MRGVLLIGLLCAIVVVAYLQLSATKNAAGPSAESPAEAARNQGEAVEKRLQEAAEENRKKLEQAAP